MMINTPSFSAEVISLIQQIKQGYVMDKNRVKNDQRKF